jgi:multidrug efflux pump subunit AcrA (membrane-fusion protein)
MFARVELRVRSYDDAIVVPRDALTREQGADVAYVVAADGEQGAVARRRAVAVAHLAGSEAVVASGLEPGDQVILIGRRALRDGLPVRVRRGDGSPAPAQRPSTKEAGS